MGVDVAIGLTSHRVKILFGDNGAVIRIWSDDAAEFIENHMDDFLKETRSKTNKHVE